MMTTHPAYRALSASRKNDAVFSVFQINGEQRLEVHALNPAGVGGKSVLGLNVAPGPAIVFQEQTIAYN